MLQVLRRLLAVSMLASVVVAFAPSSAQAYLYWTNNQSVDSSSIGRAHLDGTGLDADFIANLPIAGNGLAGIAVDGTHIYWSSSFDDSSATGTISRANLDGTDVQLDWLSGLVDPRGIALDVANDKLYWASYHSDGTGGAGCPTTIGRVTLSTGADADPGYITTTGEGNGIAVANGYLYWTNHVDTCGSVDSISSWQIGTDPATIPNADLITSNVDNPFFLAANSSNIYWPNFGGGAKIFTDAVTGGSSVDTGLDWGRGIALDASHMYWANNDGQSIGRANLDGSSPTMPFVAEPLSNIQAVAVDSLSPTPPTPPAPTPSPSPGTQSPENGCVTVPKSLEAPGTYRLMKPRCTTTAGERIRVKVSARSHSRGDTWLFRVYKNKAGATKLKTSSTPVRLTVTWWSEAAGDVPGYKKIRTYKAK